MANQSFREFKARVGSAGGVTNDEEPPVGVHLATVGVALARKTKAGNWRLRLKFRVDQGPHAGTISWWGKDYNPADEDSMKWFFGAMDTLGVDWDQLDPAVTYDEAEKIVNFCASQLANIRAQIKCGEGREFEGRKPVEVKFINPVPPGSPEPQQQQAAAGAAKVASAVKKPVGPAAPAPTPGTPPKPGASSTARPAL